MKAQLSSTIFISSLAAFSLILAPACPGQVPPGTSSSPTESSSDGFLVKSLGLLKPAERSPLTERKRAHLYLENMFGPVPLVSAVTGAAISQGLDSPTEWGQGGEGYGRRVGNSLAFNAVRQTLTYGVSYALNEDNRYFSSGKKGFWPRTLHAATSPVMASDEDGSRSISISGVTGIVGASLLSRTWSPSSWQGADNIATSMVLTYSMTAGFNFAREFMPDLIRHLKKK